MAERKLETNIPRQSIIYIVLCLTGLVIFLLGGILPANRTLADLEEGNAVIQYRIKEQTALAPLYRALREKSGKKESAILPLPEKGILSRDKVETLPRVIEAAVKSSGMTFGSAVPNLAALTGDAQFIRMDVVLRGRFHQFPEISDRSWRHSLPGANRGDRDTGQTRCQGVPAEALDGHRLNGNEYGKTGNETKNHIGGDGHRDSLCRRRFSHPRKRRIRQSI